MPTIKEKLLQVVVPSGQTLSELVSCTASNIDQLSYVADRFKALLVLCSEALDDGLSNTSDEKSQLDALCGEYSVMVPTVAGTGSVILFKFLKYSRDTGTDYELKTYRVIDDQEQLPVDNLLLINFPPQASSPVVVTGTMTTAEWDEIALYCQNGSTCSVATVLNKVCGTGDQLLAYAAALRTSLHDDLSLTEFTTVLENMGVNVGESVSEFMSDLANRSATGKITAADVLLAVRQRLAGSTSSVSQQDTWTWIVPDMNVNTSVFFGQFGVFTAAATLFSSVLAIVSPVIGLVGYAVTGLASLVSSGLSQLSGQTFAMKVNDADVYAVSKPVHSWVIDGALDDTITALFGDDDIPPMFVVATMLTRVLYTQFQNKWYAQEFIVPCLPIGDLLATHFAHAVVNGLTEQVTWNSAQRVGTYSATTLTDAPARLYDVLVNDVATYSDSSSALYFPTVKDSDDVIRVAYAFSTSLYYILSKYYNGWTSQGADFQTIASISISNQHLDSVNIVYADNDYDILKGLYEISTLLALGWASYHIDTPADLYAGSGIISMYDVLCKVYAVKDQNRPFPNLWQAATWAKIVNGTVTSDIRSFANLTVLLVATIYAVASDYSWCSEFSFTFSPPGEGYDYWAKLLVGTLVVASAIAAVCTTRAVIRRKLRNAGARRVKRLTKLYKEWIDSPDDDGETFNELYKETRRFNWFSNLWGLGRFNPAGGFTEGFGSSAAVADALTNLSNVKIDPSSAPLTPGTQISLLDIWRIIAGATYPNVYSNR